MLLVVPLVSRIVWFCQMATSTHIFISDYFIHAYRSQTTVILSKEFNNISAVATSMSPRGRTKPSSGDAAQASTRLTTSPHSPFILAHDISRGILQPVIASINALLMIMVM
jgi:hypothetical protein